MVFWKEELEELSKSQRSFSDIYRIMQERFRDEIFAEEYKDGEIIRTSYRELFEGVESTAAALSCMYPDSYNKFIAIRMANSTLWVKCFFGVLMAGMRPVLINTRLDEESVEYVLKTSGAVAVLTDEETDKADYINANGFEKKAFVSQKWADEIVLMTSGTTGTPKMVVYDGSAMCEQILVSGWVVKQNPTIKYDRSLHIRLVALLPFYHIFGLSTTLMWFGFFGRTLLFPPGMDSESIQFTCKVGHATHFFAIPLVWSTAVRKLLAQAKQQGRADTLRKAVKLSNSLQSVFPRFGAFVARNILFKSVREQMFGTDLRFCISGGGFISDEVVEIMNGLGYSLHCGYGMTETGITSVDLSRKAKHRNQNTVGRPFPIIDYKINSKGELLLKGGNLCSAFLTENGIVARNKNEYFNTGDMCSVDSRGRFLLFGRKDDVIIGENGENISPDMIEQRISVPGAVSMCVLGLDILGDTRPVAVLQLRESTSPYEKARIAQRIFSAIDGLPLTERPAKVFFTFAELPSNLGKVKRSQLRKMIDDGAVICEEMKRPESDNFDKIYDDSIKMYLDDIRGVFAQVLSKDVSEISADSHFIYDLGGDSMSYFNLVSLVSKKYSVEIKIEQQNSLFTPLDFAREIAEGTDK